MQREKVILTMLWGSWGNPYQEKYIKNMYNMVKRNTTFDFRFVLLSDVPYNIKNVENHLIPKHMFSGSFNTVKFYMHSNPSYLKDCRIFFFDLDMLIIDNIDDVLSYSGPFCGIRPFNKNIHPSKTIGGGLLSFVSGKTGFLYTSVASDLKAWSEKSQGGKERLILAELLKDKEWNDRWQDLYPNKMKSYKRHYRKQGILPEETSIVALHGKPKQHEILGDALIKKYWR